jgi:DNA repair protein RecO (recombination protein O)
MATEVNLQPAVILQQKPYRETSLLLEVFTRDHGIVSVLAKGVRKEKSKLAGLLQPFMLLNLSYLDKHELKTLTQAEFIEDFRLLRMGLYCGFYVNELLQKFLHKADPYPEIFMRYLLCLKALAAAEHIETSLRYFELDLLQAVGYGVELVHDFNCGGRVQNELRYNFVAGQGMTADASGQVSGKTLSLLAAQTPLSGAALHEAKYLLRKMLDLNLQGRPLKSREVLSKIIKYL